MRGDGFAPADGIDAFVGLRLDAHAIDGHDERVRQSIANGGEMRRELRTLENDGRVDAGDAPAAAADDLDGAAEQVEPRRVLPLRIGIGKMLADVPGARRAEQRVGERVTEDVAVGMAERTALERQRDAGQDERPALDEPMQVVARADAREPGHGGADVREIVRRRDLHIALVAGHDAHRVSGALGQHRVVGRVDAARGGRQRVFEDAPAESLRRLRQPDLLARQRLGDDLAIEIDALHGVARSHGRHRRAVLGRGRDHAIDQPDVGERPRGVVHENRIDARGERGKPQPHGILPALAAGDEAARARRRTDERRPGRHERRRQDDDELIDARMHVEHFHAALQHRPAAEIEQRLGHVRAHARAAASGDDDHTHGH